MIEWMSVVAERLADRASKLRETTATPRTACSPSGLTLLAALVRFLGLSRQSMWVDEGSTIAFTQRGLDGMLNLLLDYEANAFVYYLLVYPVTLIDGGLAPLRAFSALAGVCSIPALYWAGRTIVPRRALLIACGALCAQRLRDHAVAVRARVRARAADDDHLLRPADRARARAARAASGCSTSASTALVVYLNSLCGLLLVAAQLFVPLAPWRGSRAPLAPRRRGHRACRRAARRAHAARRVGARPVLLGQAARRSSISPARRS